MPSLVGFPAEKLRGNDRRNEDKIVLNKADKSFVA